MRLKGIMHREKKGTGGGAEGERYYIMTPMMASFVLVKRESRNSHNLGGGVRGSWEI